MRQTTGHAERVMTRSCDNARRFGRRASAMVIILGILSLLALVGLAMIAKTHGEAQRVTIETTANAEKVALEGTINTIRDILRRDIWGDPPTQAETWFERPLSNDARRVRTPIRCWGRSATS
ncbi:MAG: hypothetical protein IPK83_11280 [Planctomycetes bacterium]|nr:hypothetical protein [Planctomycetota bacterium]